METLRRLPGNCSVFRHDGTLRHQLASWQVGAARESTASTNCREPEVVRDRRTQLVESFRIVFALTGGDSRMNRLRCSLARGNHVLRAYLSVQIVLRGWGEAVIQTFRIVTMRRLNQISDLEASMRRECFGEVSARSWLFAQVVFCSGVTSRRMAMVPALTVSSRWYSDKACADSARTATAFARAGMFARENAMISRQS